MQKCWEYAFLGGTSRLLEYYMGRVLPIYYSITWGRGGVGSSKLVLRNKWTAPYQIEISESLTQLTYQGILRLVQALLLLVIVLMTR